MGATSSSITEPAKRLRRSAPAESRRPRPSRPPVTRPLRYRVRLRLSGKDSAVWISPTATMSWPQPSRSAVTPRAEAAGSLEISAAATRRAAFTRQPRLLAALSTLPAPRPSAAAPRRPARRVARGRRPHHRPESDPGAGPARGESIASSRAWRRASTRSDLPGAGAPGSSTKIGCGMHEADVALLRGRGSTSRAGAARIGRGRGSARMEGEQVAGGFAHWGVATAPAGAAELHR
jgi:hypothetical protein